MNVETYDHNLNGIILHTLEAGDPTAACMVFLHGFPECAFAWHKQLVHFARQGYRVLAPDQRGYNVSSKPIGIKAYRLEELVSDIVNLIRARAHKKVVLVGHDWGGVVAWQLAISHPEWVQQLVIINIPHPSVFRHTLKTNPKQMAKSSYAAFFQLPGLPEWLSRVFNFAVLERSLVKTTKKGTFTKDMIAFYKKAWRQPGALTAMLNWYRAFRYNTLSSTGILQLPVLLIWGRKDQFLLHQMAQASIECCANGKLVMVEESTHWIHHEQPELVNALIQEFITGHPGER
jgi:pimeloyl-ACP methyl ester carboxylesterase